jgi:hypothetical protein
VLESSRYVRDLLMVAARHWQAIWRARRATVNGGLEVNPVLGWFGDELQSWEAIRIVAREYRHSGSRLRLIRNLQDGANGNGRPASAVGFPRYELDPLDGALAREPVDDAAVAEIEIANARLRSLCEIVGETPHDDPALMLADLKRWRSTLRRIDAAARPTSPYLLALLCDHHAAHWQLLGQWVEADAASAARAERDFREQVKRTRSLWRVAFPLVERRLGHRRRQPQRQRVGEAAAARPGASGGGVSLVACPNRAGRPASRSSTRAPRPVTAPPRRQALEEFAAPAARELKTPPHAALVADDATSEVEARPRPRRFTGGGGGTRSSRKAHQNRLPSASSRPFRISPPSSSRTQRGEADIPLPLAWSRVILRNVLRSAVAAGARRVHVLALRSAGSSRLVTDDGVDVAAVGS